MGDEGNRKEVTSSVDDIIEGFSRLLKILNQDETEGKGDGNEELDSGVRKLRKLHKEIVGIQEGIEKFQLFQEGQDLYTKWLALVEQSESENNIRGKDDKATDTQAAKETKTNLDDLTALSYNNRGYLKYLQVDFEGALKDYTLALKHDPKLACAHYNRGLVTYRLAFFEQAVQDMKTAVSLDPNRKEFREGLAKVMVMVGAPNGHTFKLEYGDEDSKYKSS